MSLPWGEIRELYLKACGEHPDAEQEWAIHLTEGYRQVAARLDVPELRMPEAFFTITENIAPSDDWNDYFDLSGEIDIYAIESVHNSTDGHIMEPEAGGMSGRSRFLEATNDATTRPRPPAGTPQYWVREGSRIYIRDRPSKDTRIEVRFHIQVPELDDGDLANFPVTPQQYDRAIVLASASSFYETHPKANVPGGEGMPVPSQFFSGSSEAALSRKEPRAIEDRTSTTRMRLAGYSGQPRSR